jgi:GTP-binding protein HflX
MTAVRRVLGDIGAGDTPELLVVNKLDRAPDDARLLAKQENAPAISAVTGEGMDEFIRVISDRLRQSDRSVRLRIPWARGDVLAAVHREGEVVDQEVDDEAAILRVILDAAGRARFQEFVAS